MNRTPVPLIVLLAFAFSTSAQQSPPSDQFYQAIRSNDVYALRALVANHGSNVKDATGMTPLMLASAFGSYDAVKLLGTAAPT